MLCDCTSEASQILQAPILAPWQGPRSVVVLDNCATRHDEDVRRIIEEECGMCTSHHGIWLCD